MRPVILLLFILVLPGAASALFHLFDIRIEVERLLGGAAPPAPRAVIPRLPPQPPEWDDDAYLAAYPDVAAAVRNGGFHDGYEHYALLGAQEGRAPAFRKSKRHPSSSPSSPPPGWNEGAYLAANSDVAAAVRSGDFRDGYEHYALYGAQEGRPLAIREADRRPPPQTTPAPAPAPPVSPPGPLLKQEPKTTTEPAPVKAPAFAAAPPPVKSPPVKPPPPVKTATEAPKAEPPKPEAAKNPAKSGGDVEQVRFGRHPGFVRVVLNAEAAATHGLSADRKTLHVDFPPGVAWRAPTRGDGGDPLLTGYQTRDLGAGGKRLSVTARQPIKVLRFMILPADERQGRRLVWDLAAD